MSEQEVWNDRSGSDTYFILIDAVLETLSLLTLQLVASESSENGRSGLPSPDALIRLRESALRLAECTEEISRSMSA